jgi:excisionase family DNA binding protein
MSPKSLDDSRYLSIQKAADYTSFSVDALYKRVSDGTIPFTKVGRLLRFDKKKLDRWMADLERKTKAS